MDKRGTLGAICLIALLGGGSILAQEQATLILRSGARLSCELVDMNRPDYFVVRVSGSERRIPVSDVAVIDFTGGGRDLKESELNALRDAEQMVILRNGQNVPGRLDELGPTPGLRIVLLTERGPRELNSREVDRIYLAAPVDPSSRTIVVPGRMQWMDTGITVQQGKRVSFKASGRIILSQLKDDVAQPAGSLAGRYALRSPIPRSLAGALIGRIGMTEPFGIGNVETPLTMPASGRLFLGVNDDVVTDNSGQFSVVVRTDDGQGFVP